MQHLYVTQIPPMPELQDDALVALICLREALTRLGQVPYGEESPEIVEAAANVAAAIERVSDWRGSG